MKTDWKRILKELRQHGMTHDQIAEYLQRNWLEYTKSSVEKLSQGKVAEPSHSVGQAILNLHQQKNPRLSGLKRRDYQVNAKEHTTEFTMKYDEVSTEQLAANLEKQVDALRDTITGSGLVDDAIESAHSREKAELQKALAARINEVQNLAADVAYEREKGLDTLNQLLRAEDMLKDERVKNKTQAESIGQCLDEIEHLKRLVARLENRRNSVQE